MPKPFPSSYPKEQRWRFVQRDISNRELLAFSENILKNDGGRIDDILPDLLSFLNDKKNPKQMWLDIWVNILHQMGLGYTGGKGKYLYSTELCRYLYETKNIPSYYLYWALKFQFPFSYPKHEHYVAHGIAIQPIVLILQYLVQIHTLTKDISESYLTKNEITKFLMSAKNHDGILENSRRILALRQSGYDYAEEERRHEGFDEAGKHFFSRGGLFIRKVELIRFAGEKIFVEDERHLKRIISYLTFAKPPIRFTENSQDMRNKFTLQAYDSLTPYPPRLLAGVLGAHEKESITRIRKSVRLISTKEVSNPTDLAGTFSKKQMDYRDFQIELRRDLLALYENRCCMCGLNNRKFLRTAHIVPVKIDPSIAADRCNCLLLCVIHDVAFEYGLISLDDGYKIKLSIEHLEELSHPLLREELLGREGQKIFLPTRLVPKREYLQRHRKLNNLHD